MQDRVLAWSALVLFAAALVLPAASMLAGFASWDRDRAMLVLDEQSAAPKTCQIRAFAYSMG